MNSSYFKCLIKVKLDDKCILHGLTYRKHKSRYCSYSSCIVSAFKLAWTELYMFCKYKTPVPESTQTQVQQSKATMLVVSGRGSQTERGSWACCSSYCIEHDPLNTKGIISSWCPSKTAAIYFNPEIEEGNTCWIGLNERVDLRVMPSKGILKRTFWTLCKFYLVCWL